MGSDAEFILAQESRERESEEKKEYRAENRAKTGKFRSNNGRPQIYFLHKMEVGDTRAVPPEKKQSLYSSASNYKRKIGGRWDYTTRIREDGWLEIERVS